MKTKQQPEALRLALDLEALDLDGSAAAVRRMHAELETLRAGYDAARLEIESLRGKGWVSLPGELPDPGTPVLLDIGKTYPIRAMWAAKHTLEMGVDASDEFGEYDEATDNYYCPEGWYEWNQNEETHWAVSETPRAWRELPAAPGPADGESNG